MDELIFQQNGISVTQTLAKINGVSYPINGIGSVRIERPRNAGLFFLAVGCAVAGISLLNSPDRNNAPITAFALALIFGFLAYRSPYTLVLRTSSGDQSVMKASRTELEPVMAAIETAVARRG